MGKRYLSNDYRFSNTRDQEILSDPDAPQQSKHPFLIKTLPSLALILAAIFIFYAGKVRMKDMYDTVSQNLYDKIYQSSFDFAEASTHTSNYAVISIEGIEEISRLEVLTVSDSEFVTKNADENDSTVAWLEVQGIGIFTVDLSASEFIIDRARQSVLVRIPAPALTVSSILEADQKFWKNGSIIFNGSAAEGVHLGQAQLREGRILIENAIKQNRSFNEAAKDSAVRMIQSLVQQWNPKIPDLQVEVEFIESN